MGGWVRGVGVVTFGALVVWWALGMWAAELHFHGRVVVVVGACGCLFGGPMG